MDTTTTLTDRYVAAAMRTVPEKQRDDLAAELRASIADQIDGRIENGEDHAAAERAVLTELGDPDKLAAGYTERPLYLIGPQYYLDVVAAAEAAAVDRAAGRRVRHRSRRRRSTAQGIGPIIGGLVTTLISVAVHLCFWTTLVFAIVERTGARPGTDFTGAWSVDQLPEPRPRGVGFADLIASLVFLAVGRRRDHLGPHDRLRPGLATGRRTLSFLNPASGRGGSPGCSC